MRITTASFAHLSSRIRAWWGWRCDGEGPLEHDPGERRGFPSRQREAFARRSCSVKKLKGIRRSKAAQAEILPRSLHHGNEVVGVDELVPETGIDLGVENLLQ